MELLKKFLANDGEGLTCTRVGGGESRYGPLLGGGE